MPSITDLAPLVALRDLIRLQRKHAPADAIVRCRMGVTAAESIERTVNALLNVEEHPNLAAVGAKGAVFHGRDIPSYPNAEDVAGMAPGVGQTNAFLEGARWAHKRWMRAGGITFSSDSPEPGSDETPAGYPSIRLPLPEGVRYDLTSNNFYNADSGQGMGSEFFSRWRHRKHEFPARLDTDAVTLYDGNGVAHEMSDPELIALCRSKWPNEGRGQIPKGYSFSDAANMFVSTNSSESGSFIPHDWDFSTKWWDRRDEFPRYTKAIQEAGE